MSILISAVISGILLYSGVKEKSEGKKKLYMGLSILVPVVIVGLNIYLSLFFSK